MMGHFIRTHGLLCASILMCACGGDVSDTEAPARIASVSVSPGSATLAALGATAQMDASARDTNGNVIAAEFSWSASDINVVTVDANGRVTAQANGQATITAANGGVTASVTATVEQQVASVIVSPGAVTLAALDETAQLVATAKDSNGHPVSRPAITAEAWQRDIVYIDENFLATANRNGRTIIRFFLDETGATYSPVNVEVFQVAARMEISPAAKSFRQPNETHRFEADAWDANGHPLPQELELLYWESADSRVAVVDNTGLVTISGNGETEIVLRAYRSSVSATASVTGEVQAACAGAPRTPLIVTVEPEILVEGASVTIDGTGFCPEPAGNLVTIDGLATDVLAASETRLSVTVPQYCLPARDVALISCSRLRFGVQVDGNSPRRGSPVTAGGPANHCQRRSRCVPPIRGG